MTYVLGDSVYAVCSFRADYMWKKLESYFAKSQMLADQNDTDIHVLCVQCFEVCDYYVISLLKCMS